MVKAAVLKADITFDSLSGLVSKRVISCGGTVDCIAWIVSEEGSVICEGALCMFTCGEWYAIEYGKRCLWLGDVFCLPWAELK